MVKSIHATKCVYSTEVVLISEGPISEVLLNQALSLLCMEDKQSERVWKIFILCWTLMMFHGHGFELAVGFAHVSVHACLDCNIEYKHDWVCMGKPYQNHVHEMSSMSNNHMTKSSLPPFIVHRNFAWWGREPGSKLITIILCIHTCMPMLTPSLSVLHSFLTSHHPLYPMVVVQSWERPSSLQLQTTPAWTHPLLVWNLSTSKGLQLSLPGERCRYMTMYITIAPCILYLVTIILNCSHCPNPRLPLHSQVMQGLRKCSNMDIQYMGDPLLQPIRSFENATLVRALYHLSCGLNDRVSFILSSVVSTWINRLWTCVCSLLFSWWI